MAIVYLQIITFRPSTSSSRLCNSKPLQTQAKEGSLRKHSGDLGSGRDRESGWRQIDIICLIWADICCSGDVLLTIDKCHIMVAGWYWVLELEGVLVGVPPERCNFRLNAHIFGLSQCSEHERNLAKLVVRNTISCKPTKFASNYFAHDLSHLTNRPSHRQH